MYELYTTKTFDHRFRLFLKRHPELEDEVKRKIDLLVRDPFTSELKTHKLSGALRNQYAIWLTYEYWILFSLRKIRFF
ncbi:MAG: plasmid stabilization protein [Candidatus Edwardsbacteria bacterium]